MTLRSKLYLFTASLLAILLIGTFILVRNANLLLRHKLEQALGEGFSVEKIDLTWRSVELTNAVFKKPGGMPVLKADSVFLSLDLAGVLRKEMVFSTVVLKNPYFLIETDRRGNYLNPFHRAGDAPAGALPPVVVRRFVVHGGSMDYSDGKVSRTPLVTRLRDIELEVKDIRLPLEGTISPFVLEAAIPGNQGRGVIKAAGKIDLKTLDLGGTIALKGLDITGFKPYFQKKGDANITKGSLGLDMKANVAGGYIKAPGRAVLKNLEFQSAGTIRDTFLGVPRSGVMSLLKNRNGEIAIDFILQGDIRNPRFSLRESFAEKITIGLAENLGLSVSRIGESIVVEGARQAGKGVRGIGEGVRKLFE